MVNSSEKSILRTLFKLKIHEATGAAFEDIFTSIMNYSEPDFQQIKPWGNIGDRKNDGYIPGKGVFFQVYAPEDLQSNYPAAVSKLEKDFAGLSKAWKKQINEFYFVVNDRYKGVNPVSQQSIKKIESKYRLVKAAFKTAKDLENLLFTLEDDQIMAVTGNIPDPANIKVLDYSILNEVIRHIMQLSLPQSNAPDISLPDWNDKVHFNSLSNGVANLLNNGFMQVSNLEKYLANNSSFLADELRDKMNELYKLFKDSLHGDDLFWAIVKEAAPRFSQTYQMPVIVIMAKYFETCDIFEEPKAKI